jgi:hypothetical protein
MEHIMSIRVGLAMTLAAATVVACEQRPTENEGTTTGHPSHDVQTLASPDVQQLRQVTDQFQDLNTALSRGYAIFGGCFSDSILGGMGQHYANDPLIADPTIRLERPELLLYETNEQGVPELVAVEYIVFVDDWHAAGNTAPPRLFNTDFHINSVLLPEPFYLLHAWVWKRNPSGLVSDWNPRVSCN